MTYKGYVYMCYCSTVRKGLREGFWVLPFGSSLHVRIITSGFLLCGAGKWFSTVVVLMSLGFLCYALFLASGFYFRVMVAWIFRCCSFRCVGFACFGVLALLVSSSFCSFVNMGCSALLLIIVCVLRCRGNLMFFGVVTAFTSFVLRVTFARFCFALAFAYLHHVLV